MKIVTFYSFKGGVGRSLCALNLAWLLTSKGRRVILIDGDLHAPGLTMSGHFDYERGKKKTGIFGYIKNYLDARSKKKPAIKSFSHFVMEGEYDSRLYFVPVADLKKTFDPSDIDWKNFEKKERSKFIKYFKDDLRDSFDDPDYVLIDARTGFTEIGGLFTFRLPDIVVLFTGFNNQNIFGTEWVLKHLRKNKGQAHLIVFSPVPEGEEELKKKRIEEALTLLTKAQDEKENIPIAAIPYHPRAALNEEIFVRDWPYTVISESYFQFALKLIAINEEDILSIQVRANDLLENNKPEEALNILESGKDRYKLSKDYSNLISKALYSIGQKQEKMERFPKKVRCLEALDKYNKSLELNPDNLLALAAKGYLLEELDRYEEAVDVFGRILKIEPDNVYILFMKGSAFNELERYDEAIDTLEKLLKIEPDNVWALDDKGVALFKLGRYKEALNTLRKALKIDPEDPDSNYDLSCCYSLMGRKTDAIKQLNKAISLDPSYIEEAEEDSDLDSIRNDSRFKKLIPSKEKQTRKKGKKKKAVSQRRKK